jgi:hypothetical protein
MFPFEKKVDTYLTTINVEKKKQKLSRFVVFFSHFIYFF